MFSTSTMTPRQMFRWLGAALVVINFGLVAAAMVISTWDHLEPCPLCIMQRIVFLGVGLVGLMAMIYPPYSLVGRKWEVFLALIFSGVGAGIASWHVYLQYAPPRLTCGPDLAYMMTNWTLAKWLPAVFRGAGECTRIDWTLFSISMPTWSALCFYTMMIAALIYLFRQKH